MKNIDDKREDLTKPWGFVVFTDSFMSGWGRTAGRSLFAIAVANPSEAKTVLASGARRTDMKRGRIIGDERALRRSVKPGDHLSIRCRADCARWFQPDGFSEVA